MSAELLEEIEVLQSIYAAESIDSVQTETDWKVTYSHPDGGFSVIFFLAFDYPVGDISLLLVPNTCSFDEVEEQAQEIINERYGGCVMFQIIELIRESYEEWKETHPHIVEESEEQETNENGDLGEEAIESVFTKLQDSRIVMINVLPPGCSGLDVIHGPVTTQQKSSFQSHIAEVHSMEEIYAFRDEIVSDKKVNTSFFAQLISILFLISIHLLTIYI